MRQSIYFAFQSRKEEIKFLALMKYGLWSDRSTLPGYSFSQLLPPLGLVKQGPGSHKVKYQHCFWCQHAIMLACGAAVFVRWGKKSYFLQVIMQESRQNATRISRKGKLYYEMVIFNNREKRNKSKRNLGHNSAFQNVQNV